MADPILVRNRSRREIVGASGRSYRPGAEGLEDPSDPITTDQFAAGLLAPVKRPPAPPTPLSQPVSPLPTAEADDDDPPSRSRRRRSTPRSEETP